MPFEDELAGIVFLCFRLEDEAFFQCDFQDHLAGLSALREGDQNPFCQIFPDLDSDLLNSFWPRNKANAVDPKGFADLFKDSRPVSSR